MTKPERLQVFLAHFGIASRRGVVDIIEKGEITVNGEVVREKGFRVDPSKDIIAWNGKTLENIEQPKVYFMLNKPKGVMTTLQDPNAERTVADFFKDVPERVFPVGRLDRDTTGLLIVTNDGELSFRLTHPKFGVEKYYRVRVKGVLTDAKAERLRKGIELEEGKTAPCKLQIESRNPQETIFYMIIHEGKKRQIRRVCELVGHRVVDLERQQYGPLTLGTLKQGTKRRLEPEEVIALKKATGIKKSAPPAKG